MTTKELFQAIEYLRSCSNNPQIHARTLSAFLFISSKADVGQSELIQIIDDESSTSRTKDRLCKELKWAEDFEDPWNYKAKRLRVTPQGRRVLKGLPTGNKGNASKRYFSKAITQKERIASQLENLSPEHLDRIEQTIAVLQLSK